MRNWHYKSVGKFMKPKRMCGLDFLEFVTNEPNYS